MCGYGESETRRHYAKDAREEKGIPEYQETRHRESDEKGRKERLWLEQKSGDRNKKTCKGKQRTKHNPLHHTVVYPILSKRLQPARIHRNAMIANI